MKKTEIFNEYCNNTIKNNEYYDKENNIGYFAETSQNLHQNTLHCVLKKISYKTNRPPICNFGIGSSFDVDKFHKSILNIKFIMWEYEQEWRIILKPPVSYNGPVEKPIIFKFSPSIVSRIIFGFKIEQCCRKKLMKIFKKINSELVFL